MKNRLNKLKLTKFNYQFTDELVSDSNISDPLNEVYPNLYVGSCKSLKYVKEYNISLIICPAYELENKCMRISEKYNIPVIQYCLKDKQEGFVNEIKSSCDIIDKYIQSKKVLIVCQKGISRSATIAIYYIMIKEKCQYTKAFDMVKLKRPCIDPCFIFLLELSNIILQ